jgi:hypothetical protein
VMTMRPAMARRPEQKPGGRSAFDGSLGLF